MAKCRERDSWSMKQSRKNWNLSCWNSLLPHYFGIWSKMINPSVSWTCFAIFHLFPLTFVFCLLMLNLCDSGAGSCHDCNYCTLLGQLWLTLVTDIYWTSSLELTQFSSRNCIFNFFLLLLEKFQFFTDLCPSLCQNVTGSLFIVQPQGWALNWGWWYLQWTALS